MALAKGSQTIVPQLIAEGDFLEDINRSGPISAGLFFIADDQHK